MKKILLIPFFCLLLFGTLKGYSQTSDCKTEVQRWEDAANAKLKDKYIKRDGLGFASDNPWANIICKPHGKRNCAICPDNYATEQKEIKNNAQKKYEACDAAAINALKKQQEEADKKAADEQAAEEKARLDKEAADKKAMDQKALEKKQGKAKTPVADKKNNDPKSKNNNDYQNSKESIDANHGKYVAERRISSEREAKADADQNAAYITTVLSDPEFMHGSSYINSNYGLNISLSALSFASIPLWENTETFNRTPGTYDRQSTKGSASTLYGPFINAELHVLTNRFVDLQGLGTYYRAWSKIGGLIDRSDSYEELSIGGQLSLGLDKIKVFGGYMTGTRNLSVSSFAYLDIANADMNTFGLAGYSFQRYTAGAIFHFDSEDGDRENYLKVTVIKDNPNFNTGNFWGGSVKLRWWLDIGIEYFSNYPTAGIPVYRITGNNDQHMWSLNFSKTLTLFKGRY